METEKWECKVCAVQPCEVKINHESTGEPFNKKCICNMPNQPEWHRIDEPKQESLPPAGEMVMISDYPDDWGKREHIWKKGKCLTWRKKDEK